MTESDVPNLAVAERMLQKLRQFATAELEPDERSVLGALLGPGLAAAYDESEVAGFSAVDWAPGRLPEALVAALREHPVTLHFE